jgi:hypothetical protein
MCTVDAAGAMAEAEAEAAEAGCLLLLVYLMSSCCANCGMPDLDDIKLEECTDCNVIKYCSDKCREEHRELQLYLILVSHCALLHDSNDRKLFTQPDETHLGECPLCFLPMPHDDPKKSTFKSCCSKTICNGCCYAHHIRNGGDSCPFCREPLADEEENTKRIMKRIKANDPAAAREMGTERYFEGDHDTAVKYWKKAAELGDAEAHYQLSTMYFNGDGVAKDEEKRVYHLEKAAIGGQPDARYYLGAIEEKNGNTERSLKHLIIAAKLGYEKSMKALWDHYSLGNITKEDLEATLRTHKAAIDEMKSPEREAAEAWRKRGAQRG